MTRLSIIIFSVLITWCNANSCGQLLNNKVTDADKNKIVSKHNALRNLISQGKVPGQPKGTNLKTIQWDNYLAQQAQIIANSCEFKHVGVNDQRFYVGQNLGMSSSTAGTAGADWEGIIQMWFDEYKNFKYPTTSYGTTGHYTQVVWADTYLIGCGFTWYRKTPNSWYDKLYVCNYGPGGNWVGQAPYKT